MSPGISGAAPGGFWKRQAWSPWKVQLAEAGQLSWLRCLLPLLPGTPLSPARGTWMELGVLSLAWRPRPLQPCGHAGPWGRWGTVPVQVVPHRTRGAGKTLSRPPAPWCGVRFWEALCRTAGSPFGGRVREVQRPQHTCWPVSLFPGALGRPQRPGSDQMTHGHEQTETRPAP